MKEKFIIKATEKGIDFHNVRASQAINVACSILKEAAKAQGLTFRISKNEKENLTVELIKEEQ